MRSLEFSNLCFLLGKALTCCLKLSLKELGSVFGLLLAHFKIFINKQLGQFARDPLGDARILRRVVNLERGDLIF